MIYKVVYFYARRISKTSALSMISMVLSFCISNTVLHAQIAKIPIAKYASSSSISSIYYDEEQATDVGENFTKVVLPFDVDTYWYDNKIFSKTVANYYSMTSEDKYNKLVEAGKGLNLTQANEFLSLNPSNSWIKAEFIIQLDNSNENLYVIRYQLSKNGVVSYGYKRILSKRGRDWYEVQYVDERKLDDLTEDMTEIFGSIPKPIIRILFGFQKAQTSQEQQLYDKVTSYKGNPDIDILMELYKSKDPLLMQFLK